MAQDVKTVCGVAIASVKTVAGAAISNVKTIVGVDNTSGGGGFTPVGSVFSWLDISALALADNDPIGTITDGSGNGNNASGSGATRPLFKTGIQNSLAMGLFDGSDDFLSVSGTLNNPNTIQIVFRVLSNASRMVLFDGALLYSWISTNATPDYEYFGGSDFRVGGTPDTSTHLITVVADGASTVIRVDGSVVTLSGGAPGVNNLVGTLLGKSHNDANLLNGYIGEVVMYNGVLSGGDISTNEAGLMSKWGI